MSKQKDDMTDERWAYIKALKPTPPRMFHLSAQIITMPNGMRVVAKGNTYEPKKQSRGQAI